MADSVSLGVVRTAQLKHGAAVKAVPGVPPLYPEPYAIAVAKGRLDLQDRWVQGMRRRPVLSGVDVG